MSDLIDSPPVRSAMDDGERVSRAWAPWFSKAYAILFGLVQSGITANRPTTGLWVGRPYWDATLGKPIWWNGSVWKDATGATV